MFQSLSDWIFNRALRVSSASVVALARAAHQSPDRIRAVNDAVAGLAAHEAVRQVQAAAKRIGAPNEDGIDN